MIFNLIYITNRSLFSIWIVLVIFTYIYEKIKAKNFILAHTYTMFKNLKFDSFLNGNH